MYNVGKVIYNCKGVEPETAIRGLKYSEKVRKAMLLSTVNLISSAKVALMIEQMNHKNIKKKNYNTIKP